MSVSQGTLPSRHILYPDSDGQPMADNTLQARWIYVLYSGLTSQYRDHPDVFVAADNLWYPVKGHPEVRLAPDVYVVFGRPKADRGSYKQWEEDNVPLTVVFEILSPSNTIEEMENKRIFYELHGVEEYYVFNPDTDHLMAFVRQGEVFRRVRPLHLFTSPKLGIRFDPSAGPLVVYGADGRRFLTPEESGRERQQIEEARLRAELALLEEKRQKEQAEEARQQAETALLETQQRTRRLAELGRKARQGSLTANELEELERLEERLA